MRFGLISGMAMVLLLGCGASDEDDAAATAAASSGSGASGGGGNGSGASSTGTGAGGEAASGGSGTSAGGSGGGTGKDEDGDGIDDQDEAKLAEAYLPFLSVHPDDGCTLGGIVFRLYPHPEDPTRLHVVYDHLFETDCGVGGHVGDNEVFAATIDPAVPPPEGILALRAISHQATLCEVISECGAACGLEACDTKDAGGKALPVVFSSRDKHGGYALQSKCAATLCFDSCAVADAAPVVPMVNAGEPDAHLIEDLTDEGFINRANGWTEQSLFHVNPWDTSTDFGGAGNIAEDLVDPAFLTPACP